MQGGLVSPSNGPANSIQFLFIEEIHGNPVPDGSKSSLGRTLHPRPMLSPFVGQWRGTSKNGSHLQCGRCAWKQAEETVGSAWRARGKDMQDIARRIHLSILFLFLFLILILILFYSILILFYSVLFYSILFYLPIYLFIHLSILFSLV